MAGQIVFFQKNWADIDFDYVVATASQSTDLADLTRNRNNTSAWITSGSVDADNTTFEVDFGEEKPVTDILLLKHNFKSYKIEYWNGSAYVAMPSAIDLTTNTAESKWHSFTELNTQKLRITIRGTMTANEDKYLYQFIATKRIGTLVGWPVIDQPVFDRNKNSKKMLSGKANILESVGAFSFDMKVPNWKSDADLTVVETLYDSTDGFLTWPCGGDETQFSSVRQGYRMEDIFLMKTSNNFAPEWRSGLYQNGLDLKVKLTEVIG